MDYSRQSFLDYNQKVGKKSNRAHILQKPELTRKLSLAVMITADAHELEKHMLKLVTQ